MRRLLLPSLPLVACACTLERPLPPAPCTAAEASHWRRTSSLAEVRGFLEALRATGDPRLQFTSLGRSGRGEALPMIVVADPPVRAPEDLAGDIRPRIYVQGDIHGGEVEGKEAILELLRAVVYGPGEPWPVDRVVVLFVPVYNADGNDAMAKGNRRYQNGPPVTGQRANAGGLDLNRDFLKADAPETRALLAMLEDWDPHLLVDLHTTDGSPHGYQLTYAPPLHPDTPAAIRDLLDRDWLPALRRDLAAEGFRIFDYGNFVGEGGFGRLEPQDIRAWRTYDHRPRYVTNGMGLRNRAAILSEAFAYEDFRTRIAVTRAFVAAILQRAATDGASLRAACAAADRETVRAAAAGRLEATTAAATVARGAPEAVVYRRLLESTDPASGLDILHPAAGTQVLSLPCQVRFRATRRRTVPRAWLLPPELEPIVALAERHGIRVERLTSPGLFRVTRRTVRQLRKGRQYQGHQAWRLEWDPREESVELPAGSWRIPSDQPLALLAFHLLDPEAEDGVVAWGLLEPWLAPETGAECPVLTEEADQEPEPSKR